MSLMAKGWELYDNFAVLIDKRLHKMGINFPFLHYSRRAKTFFKFGMVGVTGTIVDFFFYKLFINWLGLPPATSKGFSTEIAIVNNFLFNNYWTFKHRSTGKSIWHRFGIFNLVSLGGLIIAVLIVKALDTYFGEGTVNMFGTDVAYNNFYFFATIPFVMVWNFTMNHLVTWRNKSSKD